METLDLHGVLHDKVEATVEDFILLNEMPVKIITGNSVIMRQLVVSVLQKYGFRWDYESHFNLGAIVVIDP